MNEINPGVCPTMITPFTPDNKLDYPAISELVKWFIDKGCKSIFAVCQSSEMAYLSLEEKKNLSRSVVEAAKEYGTGISVVASGHTSDGLDAQAEELTAIHETGADAIVLVSNRLDLHNDGDSVWIKNARQLLEKLPEDASLGIYECPIPYKRLLSKEILEWCISTGRFKFIKDTCCDPMMLDRRLAQLKGSGIKLFNANDQTLLHSLKSGAAGYSGIMANFHPEIHAWLCENYAREPEKAQAVQNYLSLYAFTDSMAYPLTAKYHMNLTGVPMSLFSRTRDMKQFTAYQKLVVDEQFILEKEMLLFIKSDRTCF